MDKHQLIDSIIVELNSLTVQGVQNMSIIVRTIQNLSTLNEGLKQETENYRARILELEEKVKNMEEGVKCEDSCLDAE